MEWQFCINWPALVEEAKLRRKAQKLTQVELAKLAGVSTPTVSHFESGETDIQLPTVLNIFDVLGMVDQRKLVFPKSAEYYDPSRKLVIFTGKDSSKLIQCGISRETLEDHFGLVHQEILKVFANHRARIEQEIRRKYLNGKIEADSSVLVKTEDLENKN